MGRDLYSSDGVEIGEIEDFILNQEGRVVSVVVEVETRLGLADKYVTVPFAGITMGGADRRVTVAMTRDQRRSAPSFRYED